MANLKDGVLIDPMVTQNIVPNIERNALDVNKINAIVVHQTDNWSAKQTFDGWTGTIGAHFVIDRGDTDKYKGIDGKIYQTARLNRTCNHVGYIQSRCYLQKSCAIPKGGKTSAEAKALDYKKGWADRAQAIETPKSYPDRFPYNGDSIGIEVVTKFDDAGKVYPAPSPLQMRALAYLISKLIIELPQIDFPKSANDADSDIYSHGYIGRKQASEGVSAVNDLIGIYTSNFGLNIVFYPMTMMINQASKDAAAAKGKTK